MGSRTRLTALNGAWAAGTGIFSQFSLLLVTPIIIAKVGIGAYGLWALCATIMRYGMLLDIVTAPVMKYVATYQSRGESQRVRQVITFALLFYLALACVIVPVVAVLAPFLLHFFKVDAAIATAAPRFLAGYALYASLMVATSTFSIALGGLGLLRRSAAINGIGQIVFSVVTAAFALAHFGLESFLIGSFVQLAFVAIAGYVVCRRTFGPLFVMPNRFELAVVKPIVTFGGWLQISTLALLFGTETGQVVVGILVGLPAVAVLDMGNRLARSLRAFSYYFGTSLMPTIAAMETEVSAERVDKAWIAATRYFLVLTTFVAAFLVGSAHQVVEAWLGPQTIAPLVAAVLIVLTVCYSIENFASVQVATLRALAKPQIEAKAAAVNAILNVALIFALAPRFGIFGVLAAAGISTTASVAIITARFHHFRRLNFWDTTGTWTAKLFTIAALSGCETYVLLAVVPQHLFRARITAIPILIVAGCIFAVTYVALLRGLRFLRAADSEIASRILPSTIARSRALQAMFTANAQVRPEIL